MLWRVSIGISIAAEFSTFEGCHRFISMLVGDGMVLTLNGRRSRELLPYDVYAFDGSTEVRCGLLGGAIRGFNLIYSKKRITAKMRWVTLAGTERLATFANIILVFNSGINLSVCGHEGSYYKLMHPTAYN